MPVLRVLFPVIDACRLAAGANDSKRDTATIAAWSLVHGLAALLVDGPLAPMAANREQVHALAATITSQLKIA